MTRIELPEHDTIGVRADNPGPFTLSGTNSWIVGRDPAWLVDPGPAIDAHLDALIAELEVRGGLGGIALTHDHADHAEGVPAIRAGFRTLRWRRRAARSTCGSPRAAGSDRSRRSRRPATPRITSRSCRAGSR